VTFFGDVMAITSLNDVIIDFLKFDFVIISLKKHNLAKLRNISSSKLKIKGRRALSAWRFLKICYLSNAVKAHLSQLKNLKHFDLGSRAPLATPLNAPVACPCGHTINFKIRIFCTKKCKRPHLKNSSPLSAHTSPSSLLRTYFMDNPFLYTNLIY